jgi:lipopolysaccharide biosynthesis glycosyltransferase
LNLFTTIDARWLPYACMMIRSVRTHTPGAVRYWIIHEDIASPQQTLVTDWGTREDIDIRFVDFARQADADGSGALGGLESQAPQAPRTVFWGRYHGHLLLPADVRRVVYADVDMIAVADLSPLAAIDLQGRPVGAVEYLLPGAAKAIGLDHDEYFNNGLLVIDLETFDSAGCVRCMTAKLREGPLPIGAQCAFNFAMQGQITRLDEEWNVQGNRRVAVGGRARLVHFTGDTKPWHALAVDPLRPEVRATIHETPFPEAWEPDASLHARARLLARAGKGLLRRLLRAGG